MNQTQFTLEEFNKNFKFVKNYLKERREWDGCLFGKNGDEVTYARSKSRNSQTLTIFRDEIITGFHRNGKELGFLVLEKPYESDFKVTI